MIMLTFGQRLAELNRDKTPPDVSEAFIEATRQTIDTIKALNSSGFLVTATDLAGQKTQIGKIFRSEAAEARIYIAPTLEGQLQPDGQEIIIDLQDIVSFSIEDHLYPPPAPVVLKFF